MVLQLPSNPHPRVERFHSGSACTYWQQRFLCGEGGQEHRFKPLHPSRPKGRVRKETCFFSGSDASAEAVPRGGVGAVFGADAGAGRHLLLRGNARRFMRRVRPRRIVLRSVRTAVRASSAVRPVSRGPPAGCECAGSSALCAWCSRADVRCSEATRCRGCSRGGGLGWGPFGVQSSMFSWCGWQWAHQKPGQQKPPFPFRKRRSRRGEILVRRISLRRTSKGTRPSATVGFLRPRLAALVSQCVPDVV
jgi:hypothetical protein